MGNNGWDHINNHSKNERLPAWSYFFVVFCLFDPFVSLSIWNGVKVLQLILYRSISWILYFAFADMGRLLRTLFVLGVLLLLATPVIRANDPNGEKSVKCIKYVRCINTLHSTSIFIVTLCLHVQSHNRMYRGLWWVDWHLGWPMELPVVCTWAFELSGVSSCHHGTYTCTLRLERVIKAYIYWGLWWPTKYSTYC